MGTMVLHDFWAVSSAQDMGIDRQRFLCRVLGGHIGKLRAVLFYVDGSIGRIECFRNLYFYEMPG